ncbi:hypothetical protein Kpho02_31820 [Kitasatospora phosalacinea]|uniref:Uncharacterized protein n=1 Tax=Kitasatospora phosalacinea TaxID=2065 RepID=A0A9W6Q9J5_9ACTN|nr:hypothetical protein [Kitasatospora phosalacinea]GLW70883.1 hypothetical protein Kpho02_31820 [Kitasatospora phosalacinea]
MGVCQQVGGDWYDDRGYAAEVERGERVARWGLAVSAGVAALVVGALLLAFLLVLAVVAGSVLLLADR